MKTISEINNKEWAELVVYIDKKILGKLKYPYPHGLSAYRDEVITSLCHIKDGIADKLRHSRLAPVLTIEYLPWFVIKWLQKNNFEIE